MSKFVITIEPTQEEFNEYVDVHSLLRDCLEHLFLNVEIKEEETEVYLHDA